MNVEIDTNRGSAPATFWAVAAFWMLVASIGLGTAVAHWGR